MEKWVTQTLTIGAADGNVTQLYPTYAAVGINPATATTGQQMREPTHGQLISLQIKTDGTNAGTLELYDISGTLLGIDVSSTDVITDAQLDAAITAGNARLIFDQNFIGAGTTPLTPVGPAGFSKGLAARAVGSTGTCRLNLTVQGGFRYTTKAG